MSLSFGRLLPLRADEIGHGREHAAIRWTTHYGRWLGAAKTSNGRMVQSIAHLAADLGVPSAGKQAPARVAMRSEKPFMVSHAKQNAWSAGGALPPGVP